MLKIPSDPVALIRVYGASTVLSKDGLHPSKRVDFTLFSKEHTCCLLQCLAIESIMIAFETPEANNG